MEAIPPRDVALLTGNAGFQSFSSLTNVYHCWKAHASIKQIWSYLPVWKCHVFIHMSIYVILLATSKIYLNISRNWWMLPTSSLTPRQQTYISSTLPTIFQYNPDKRSIFGVFPKIWGFTTQIIPSKNRVCQYVHHPFWGIPIFGNTHLAPRWCKPPTSQCCDGFKPWIPGGITSQCLVQQVDHTTFLKDLNQVANLEVSLPEKKHNNHNHNHNNHNNHNHNHNHNHNNNNNNNNRSSSSNSNSHNNHNNHNNHNRSSSSSHNAKHGPKGTHQQRWKKNYRLLFC